MEGHEHVAAVIGRLSRIEGHVRGIKKMLEDGAPCDQVLIQFAAVKAAMHNAAKLLLEDHFDHCIMGRVTDRTLEKELLEFRNALDKFVK